MATYNKNKHLTLSDRITIATEIHNNSTKKAIALKLGKDQSTIAKEIKSHRTLTYKCKLPLECSNYSHCKHGRFCTSNCVDLKLFTCKRRDRSPGACNGCSRYSHCRFNKFRYSPQTAQLTYATTLVDARVGINMTVQEAKKLGELIKPLIIQGQSPYQIIQNHPEINLCEKTLYNYIEDGVFTVAGIQNIDLRIKVRRKLSKAKSITYKKRSDWKFLKGRKYTDYLAFVELNPDASIVQMDTVYNDISKGPFIQTFKFLKTGFIFGILHSRKDAESMVNGLNILEDILGQELFSQLVYILLTDRGTEFAEADGLEFRVDGSQRTNLFYCDPMQSCQKGSLENNHKELRYILPNKVDLYDLGLSNQNSLNLVLSHVNSLSKEKLNGKSPIELTEFLYPLMMQKLYDFGITKIESDNIILKPYLLK